VGEWAVWADDFGSGGEETSYLADELSITKDERQAASTYKVMTNVIALRTCHHNQARM
jgi:hypothetical protein